MKNLNYQEVSLSKPITERVFISESQLAQGQTKPLTAFQKKLGLISIHLSIWLIYKFFFYYFNVIQGEIPFRLFWLFTAFSNLIEPLVFYSYYFYFTPRWLEEKKILYFLIISITLISFLPIPAIYYVDYLQNTLTNLPPTLQSGDDYWGRHLLIGFNILVLICVASGARFAVDWFKNQQLKTSLEKQNMMSEVALLRSQVNPHFLFNTLNNIYSLVYKQDKNAPMAVLKLSELMRYMIYEAGNEKVKLSKEIDYINSYIDLQKLRLKNPMQVRFEVEGNYHDKFITPMLLIPFVENAFKHGVSLQNPESIAFKLSIREDSLDFWAENAIVNPQRVEQNQVESGIGMKNLHKRLELLYPHKHHLEINQDSQKYKIHLKIDF